MTTKKPHPLSVGRYSLEQTSGRNIGLRCHIQRHTYELMLFGTPYRDLNSEFIERHLRWAREWAEQLSLPLAPVLIEPRLSPIPHQASDPRGPLEALPTIVTFAVFDSVGVDPSNMCSSVLVVWYQNRWGLPTQRVATALRTLDWEPNACDWSW